MWEHEYCTMAVEWEAFVKERQAALKVYQTEITSACTDLLDETSAELDVIMEESQNMCKQGKQQCELISALARPVSPDCVKQLNAMRYPKQTKIRKQTQLIYGAVRAGRRTLCVAKVATERAVRLQAALEGVKRALAELRSASRMSSVVVCRENVSVLLCDED